MSELVDDLMEYGDLRYALRNLMQSGMRIPEGGYMQGLRDMLRQLREQRRERLERFNMDSIMDNIRERLDEILKLEKDHINQWMDDLDKEPPADAPEGTSPETPEGGDQAKQNFDSMLSDIFGDKEDGEQTDFSKDLMRQIAERNQGQLNQLPPDSAGQMKALEEYEFMSSKAQDKFLELLNEMKRAMTQTFFKDIEKMVNEMSDGDIERMKDMVRDLNEMLVKHIAGDDPGFEDFMQKYGDMFGDNPPKSIDDLLEMMRQQMAAAQSMMNSMSPEQREQLQSLLSDRLGDPELEAELRKLGKEMDFLNPEGQNYRFGGSEELDLDSAMNLMNEMHDLDELMSQVQQAQRDGNVDSVDADKLRDLLGDDTADSFDDLKKLLDTLEDAGYIRRKGDGDDAWELTPRGSRIIGQKALGEIYTRLKRQSLGNHATPEEGRFGERLEQTKPYEFGDPFHLHLPRTIRNALEREGPHSPPIKMAPEDFEIYRSELITQTATVMMVDLSWSMALRGAFQAAKKVSLALHNLVTSQYPKDSFYIIGFAAYARELKAHDLPYLQWDEYVLGTNMQHALLMAERLLAKHNVGTKQIIMISDGEPTAHIEDGQARFAYPPSPVTIHETLKAVKRCTQKGIAINTFMLDASYHLKSFVNQVAKINGGRVFYTSPEKLGEYILVDYVQHKRKRLARR
ncbi:MAG: VWA domain-containing protein [Pseudomonadota bacterium]